MTVKKRNTSKGQTQEFHYRFMQNGKSYSGVCAGCDNELDAIAFEKKIKATIDDLKKQKNVKALVENFREELSGGEKILLKNAFCLALEKPQRKKSSESHLATKKSQFNDFCNFMNKKYPDIKLLDKVQKKHAEAYISYLRSNGKFDKKIVFKNNARNNLKSNYNSKLTHLASSTINGYHKSIRHIFSLLQEDAGIYKNPFDLIDLMKESQEYREAFTQEELELIIKNANPFIKAIFMLGFFTAFREGDIATLKWNEILWEHNIIRKRLLKTGNIVEVPIMQPLYEFLNNQLNDTEFVLPEHASMYLNNPSGISYRVKNFLENELKIKTTKTVDGRSRAVSVKDVHSLRHTFCYFAGVAGIPLVVVQSIVGHLTPEMTAHYTAHTDRKTKHEKMLLMPSLQKLENKCMLKNLIAQKRAVLIKLISTADSTTLDKIELILRPHKSLRNKLQEKSK